ncbi:MAG TPA: GNAT family N-acetyltransferase, partial [Allosphingosinicella sp.]|nr:GNAT family N-acetyltransferase [Allosphingosinicella sp.]
MAPVRGEAASSAAGVDIRFHDAAGAIEALAHDWVRLAAEAAEPNAFAEHWFVAASLRAFAAGRDVRLLEARRAGRLIGLLPLTIEQGYAHLPVRFVQNWYHDHAFLGTPLVAAGEERAFWAAAIEALGRSDWAPGFLHLWGIAEGGPVHRGLAKGAIVHRRFRAFLDSDLAPQAYFERAVRPKKRKELRRLRNRLAEQGPIACRVLDDRDELDAWCDAYLAMEAAGWKGQAGSALVDDPRTESFFRDVVAAAWSAGRLQFLRLEVGARPVAMLVNFLTAPGSFSF